MIDDDLRVAAAGVIVLVLVFNVSGYYLAGRNAEPFSELGVLGPNQKIADYPSSVLAGQNFTLYLYVGNHEGRVMYYDVLVKLGDRSNAVQNASLAVPPIASYGMVLRDNQTYLSPVTFSLGRNGTNVRLVFELWAFETNSSAFAYDLRSTWIYLNVTGPSV